MTKDFLNSFDQISCTQDTVLHHEEWSIIFKEKLPECSKLYSDEDKILYVPILDYNEEKLQQSAMECLLAAATDRNIVVYDSQSEVNEISSRLLGLMYNVMRKKLDFKKFSFPDISFKCNPITDIFYRASNTPIEINYHQNIKHHPISEIDWDYIEDYYLNNLHGSYAANDKNLLIAVTTDNSKNNFLCAVLEGNRYGLAVLDNTRVILGSY